MSYLAANIGELTEMSLQPVDSGDYPDSTKYMEAVRDKSRDIDKKAKELGNQAGSLAKDATLASFFRIVGLLFTAVGLGVMFFKGNDVDRLGAMIVAGLLLASAIGGALFGML